MFLVLLLQTSLFAQISNTAGAEIKYFPNSAYPKNTDVAMVNDTTSVIFSEITAAGVCEEAFYLIIEGNSMVSQVIVRNNMLVYDIDVLNDTLFFCGNRNSKAFVAWADIPTFFSTGVFNYQEISEISYISKIKPYHSSLGYLNLACLSSTNTYGGYCSYITQVDVVNSSYIISSIPAITGFDELCSDIIVYNDYILVAGYMENNTNPSPYGWSVRVYDKDNIANIIPHSFMMIQNYGNYVDRLTTSFLAKSKDEKKVVLISTAWTPDDISWNGTILSIFDLDITINGLDYVNRYDTYSTLPIYILWDVDMCYGDNGYYDLVMQTYDGGSYSSVFHANLTYPTTMGCNIYTNQNLGMYSSIKTYSDYYFISVGDIQWDLSIWDRKLGAGNSDCDGYSYNDIIDIQYRQPLYIPLQPSSVNNMTPWQHGIGEITEIAHNIKCIQN